MCVCVCVSLWAWRVWCLSSLSSSFRLSFCSLLCRSFSEVPPLPPLPSSLFPHVAPSRLRSLFRWSSSSSSPLLACVPFVVRLSRRSRVRRCSAPRLLFGARRCCVRCLSPSSLASLVQYVSRPVLSCGALRLNGVGGCVSVVSGFVVRAFLCMALRRGFALVYCVAVYVVDACLLYTSPSPRD